MQKTKCQDGFRTNKFPCYIDFYQALLEHSPFLPFPIYYDYQLSKTSGKFTIETLLLSAVQMILVSIGNIL